MSYPELGGGGYKVNTNRNPHNLPAYPVGESYIYRVDPHSQPQPRPQPPPQPQPYHNPGQHNNVPIDSFRTTTAATLGHTSPKERRRKRMKKIRNTISPTTSNTVKAMKATTLKRKSPTGAPPAGLNDFYFYHSSSNCKTSAVV